MTNSQTSSSRPTSTSFAKLDRRIQQWIHDSNWDQLRDVQERAIPVILAGDRDVVIAASTASGKTEAAMLPILTRIAEESPELQLAVYISPLKALINDQWGRLDLLCERMAVPVTPWHGDINASRKQKFQKSPRGCLLITPESLEALLMRQGQAVAGILAGLKYIVIDELHAFMGSERGIQLQSQLRRIELLLSRRIVRVGLSATLGDMDSAKEFLRPGDGVSVELIESKERTLDLKVLVRGVVVPAQPPQEKVSGDSEAEIEDTQLTAASGIALDLFRELRLSNNLIFPNSRRSVEFFADKLRQLSEEARVPNAFWPHHGNLSKDIREQTEAALKQKELPATAICTSTLELGIDIGSVKSVAQVGSAPSVASLRQRLGRSGRRKGESAILRGYVMENQLTSHASLNDLLRSDLVQSVAMIRLLVKGWYEPIAQRGIHGSTLVQQLLSVIVQYGGVLVGKLYGVLCERGAFSSVDRSLFASLLRSLAKHEIIFQDTAGLILLAPKGERMTEHYSFYAVFSTPEEYRIVNAGRMLGSMEIGQPLATGSFLIFAGRRWQVVNVSEEDRSIEVSPGKGGSAPSFTGGSSASVHDQVRLEMREVLRSAEAVPFLDKTAAELLREGRENYAQLDLNHVSIRQVGQAVQLILWKGDVVNTTIALVLSSMGLSATNEGIYVEVDKSTKADVLKALREIAEKSLDPLVIANACKLKSFEKWDDLLPEDVLDIDFASKNLDLAGAVAAARICTDDLISHT